MSRHYLVKMSFSSANAKLLQVFFIFLSGWVDTSAISAKKKHNDKHRILNGCFLKVNFPKGSKKGVLLGLLVDMKVLSLKACTIKVPNKVDTR